MPTQEERLSALEKFQREAAAHIRETEENTTILLGVLRDQGRDIRRLVQHLETIDERLNSLEPRLDTLESRLDTLGRDMESRFETLESRFETLESRFGTLESRFGTLESHFEAQDKKLDQMLHLLTTLTAKPGQGV